MEDDRITTHKEFRSAFVNSEQRRAFLLDCVKEGFKSILANWPECDVRLFVFGSTANGKTKVLASSDLDIAVSGLDHIASKSHQCAALIMEAFKRGLSAENRTLPVDVVTFNPNNPTSTLSMEILKNGTEIKLGEEQD